MPLSTCAARPGTDGKFDKLNWARFCQYYVNAHAQIDFWAGNLKVRVMVDEGEEERTYCTRRLWCVLRQTVKL